MAAVKESLTTALDSRHNIAILTLPTVSKAAGDYNQNYQAHACLYPSRGCLLQPETGFFMRLLRVWVRSQKRRWWRLKGWIWGDDKQRQ